MEPQPEALVRPPAQGTAPALAALRSFVRRGPAVERCELCGLAVPSEHQHLLEVATQRLTCCCDMCAILFAGGQNLRFRPIPRRATKLTDFVMTEAQWDDLQIPIKLACFRYSTPAARITAFYPSPAGPIESLLSLESWQQLALDNPALDAMQADVEGLLVNRLGAAERYFLVPIDECYRLIGLIRAHWKGLSGGTEVWRQIEQFFTRLNETARPAAGVSHA